MPDTDKPLKGPGLLPRTAYLTVYEDKEDQTLLTKENSLIEEYGRMMAEKHELMAREQMLNQQIYRLEEDMAYLHKDIQQCQRIRLIAANAALKDTKRAKTPSLTKETGLTEQEIEKALNLMKKADIGH